MLLRTREYSPFLHKDHYLAAGIKAVLAICCQEEVAREHVWGLLLPLQVCKLHLQLGTRVHVAQYACCAARRQWLGAWLDAWDKIKIEGWLQDGHCTIALCWGGVQ